MKKIDVSQGFELGPFHFTIITNEQTDAELHGRQRLGECDFSLHVLRVVSGYGDEQYHETFIHECIEAANEIYCNSKIKHDEISSLANGLAQVLMSLGVQFYLVKVA